MKRNFIRGLLGVLLAGVSSLAFSEDIDLFVGNSGDGQIPNVLLVLDNGANFSASADFNECPDVADWPSTMLNTTGGIEQCALYKVVESLTPGTANLGVMVFNGNDLSPSCPGGDGGCLVYPITLMDEAGQAAMMAWIKTWKTSGSTDLDADPPELNIKSNSNKNGAAMQEAWAMYAGRTGLSGRDYAAIKPASACGKNYVVFVGNSFNNSGSPNDGGSAKPKAPLLGALTGGNALKNAFPAATTDQQAMITGPIAVSCEGGGSFTFPTNANHENGGYYADEWARYMESQGIETYTIGLLNETSCKKSYEALMISMGNVGGGKYFPTNDYSGLKAAFETVLSEIQSVNSVFASVSLPVSVNTQGTYLNQVFVGMFRPDEEAKPRWYGNLKQYKLGFLNNTLKLVDAEGDAAISSSDSGFIAECARSYWTPLKSAASSNLFWADIDSANCLGYAAASETPDGNMVEKGGQGYKLRAVTPANRTVFTCDDTCTTALAQFNSSNEAITKAALGDATMSDATRSDLIDWARGSNNDTVAEDIGGKTELEERAMTRLSVHGDVVHSRPVAINYAATDADDPKVVVFYGGNDGMLRAVNGNRDGGLNIGTSPNLKAPGEELWSFVAPESYGLFSRIKANTPLIKFPNIAEGEPKDYGFDGPVTAYKTASTAWIYATMRRGGRMLYAFDVSTPQSPSLKWRVGCPNQANDDGCTSVDISGIGQTWAVPSVIQSAGYVNESAATKPMLIMGGGYDPCEDADPATSTCKSSGKGHAIYLLDADTGTRLQTFNTDGGVVGDVVVLKDANGLAEYAYAADLAGNVYRISGSTATTPIASTAPGSWVITKIARLGGSDTAARKFFFGPDIVVDGNTHYLLLGSGDREKPVSAFPVSATVQNYFFMLKDQPTTTNWLTDESTNCTDNLLCMSSLVLINSADAPTDTALALKKGWALELDSTEQVVTSALTIFGTVYFSTHQPAAAIDPDAEVDQCANTLGDSRSYSISFRNATGANGERYADLVGDGLPPSPVAGLVTLDDGTTVPFCIGCNPESPLEGGQPESPPGAVQPKARVFWNVEQ